MEVVAEVLLKAISSGSDRGLSNTSLGDRLTLPIENAN